MLQQSLWSDCSKILSLSILNFLFNGALAPAELLWIMTCAWCACCKGLTHACIVSDSYVAIKL